MANILLLLILAGVIYLGILQYFSFKKLFSMIDTQVKAQLDAMAATLGDIVTAEAAEDSKLSEILAAEQDEDAELGKLSGYVKQIIANEGSGADQSETVAALTDFNGKLEALKTKAAQRTADLQPIVDKAKAQTDALKAIQIPVVAPPATTDKSYTDTAGETIVVSQAGDLPAVGETVTVNGAPATQATYTLSDGAILNVTPDSKVASYTPAQA
jgi:hypothetical protein